MNHSIAGRPITRFGWMLRGAGQHHEVEDGVIGLEALDELACLLGRTGDPEVDHGRSSAVSSDMVGLRSLTGTTSAHMSPGCLASTGRTPRAVELGVRPVSNLINTPNVFSVIVAVLAGMVGVVSLTESRASTLIGVFISVTTIPAASDIGLSLAYSSWSEARGSFFQLLLNVVILIVVGMVMLVLQKRVWDRVTPASC